MNRKIRRRSADDIESTAKRVARTLSPREILMSVLLPAAVVAVVVVVLLWRLAILNELSAAEDRADLALSQATTLESHFSDSQNAFQGYLLTGTDAYLAQYQRHEDDIRRILRSLTPPVGGDRPQSSRLAEMWRLYQGWHDRADATMAARSKIGQGPATGIVLSGKSRMDALRAATSQFIDAERTERDDDAAAARRAGETASIVGVAGVVVVIAVLVFGARQALLEGARIGQREWEERAQLEEARRRSRELQAQNARILEAARIKSEFVANMSHELRTPLTAILGLGEMLRDEKVGAQTDRQKSYLDDILSSGRHLLKLINDVLDLAKVEAGAYTPTIEQADPRKLAREVVEIVKPLAAKKGVSVALDDVAAPASVRTDVSRFRQILFNFLSNGIKFTPAGGAVAVRIGSDGPGRFKVAVSDTGIGIRPDDIPKLFVEFSQLDSGSARSHDGAGLGLALTKRLVEAQGGEVGVTSVLGKGSTFYATLPTGMPDGWAPAAVPAEGATAG